MRKKIRRDEILRKLGAHLDELRAMGVTSLELFGSVARDEATTKSDVDLMVDIDPERHIGLFGFVAIQQRIEEILGGLTVDLTMRDCVYDEFKDDIFREAIRVA